MRALTVTAPGKIVLAGEYAVLHGAHAIAAAVSRRACVTIRPVDRPGVELHTPGLGRGSVRFETDTDGKLLMSPRQTDGRDFGLFESTWNAAVPQPERGLHITLDTTAFIDAASGDKLGLGSSAAVCVALTAALRPDLAVAGVAELAATAHRRFQAGGSGVDIACSSLGEFIDFQMAPAKALHVAMPRGLHFAVLWSGKPVKTAAKITSLEAGLQDPLRHATLQSLKTAADLLAKSWRSGDAATVYQQFSDYIAALYAFDLDMKLDIFGSGHAALADAATQSRLLYKPCGAGGGDVGVAIALNPALLTQFVARAPDFGFTALDLQLGESGMCRDGDRHGG